MGRHPILGLKSTPVGFLFQRQHHRNARDWASSGIGVERKSGNKWICSEFVVILLLFSEVHFFRCASISRFLRLQTWSKSEKAKANLLKWKAQVLFHDDLGDIDLCGFHSNGGRWSASKGWRFVHLKGLLGHRQLLQECYGKVWLCQSYGWSGC